jgi:uncharacterized protein (UPF0335 family)
MNNELLRRADLEQLFEEKKKTLFDFKLLHMNVEHIYKLESELRAIERELAAIFAEVSK